MAAVLDRTANEIILAALQDSGIIRPDQVPSSEDTATALDRLNSITKHWQAQGYHLWAQTEGVLFTDVGTESYFLGPDGDEATTDDDFIPTETTADLAISATSVSVTSTTGMLGAVEIITIDPLSTQFWTPTNADVSVVSGNLRVTNNTTAQGFADFDLTCTVGQTYRVVSDFVVVTSSGIISIRDPVADSQVITSGTLSVNTLVTLEFVATQEIMTFRLKNLSITDTESTEVSSLSQIDKASGDNIGIGQDDGTRHWTNIVEVVDTTTVTIEDGMISAATTGVQVFTYTDTIERPLRLYNERSTVIGTDTSTEIIITDMARQEYMQEQSLKSTQGTITQAYYSPQLAEGRLYVWPTSSTINQVVRFTFDRPLQTNDSQIDNPDFPSEWFMTLKWNLAKELLPGYRVPQETAAFVVANAAQTLQEALDFDEETGSLFAMPDMRTGRR